MEYLPKLEEYQIDYWVYGGVAVAAYAGKFFRENTDVDIFVKEDDFIRTNALLKEFCIEQNAGFKECNLLNRNDFSRPKLEVKIDRHERMSVVPVYLRGGSATLVFGNGAKSFPKDMLKRVARNLSKYGFFTPPNTYIKEIFLNCFQHRKGWKEREDIRKDARIILSPEEFKNYFCEVEIHM